MIYPTTVVTKRICYTKAVLLLTCFCSLKSLLQVNKSIMAQQQCASGDFLDSIDDYSLDYDHPLENLTQELSSARLGSNDSYLLSSARLGSNDSYLLSSARLGSNDSYLGVENRITLDVDPMPSSVANEHSASTMGAENANVKSQLKSRLKEKMRAEGKEEAWRNNSDSAADKDQPTPEDIQKRIEKQERNKEAARKSRQKKKENEQKLREDYMLLTSENQDLHNRVKYLKLHNEVCSKFFDHHECVVPQQDHGDESNVETSGNNALIDTDEPCLNGTLSGNTEEAIINTILSLSTNLPIIKMKSVQEIREELQSGHSEIVTTSTQYGVDNCGSYDGFNIGIQENQLPNSSSEVKVDRKEISFAQVDSCNVYPPVTDQHVKSSNSAVSLSPATPYVDAWTIEANNQREQHEAMEAVLGTYLDVKSICKPPPEKKPRLE